MNNTRAINVLLIVLTIGAFLRMLLAGSEGLLVGVAVWPLVAGLCILLTVLSVRARRYANEVVRQVASETGHEVVQPKYAAEEHRGAARTCKAARKPTGRVARRRANAQRRLPERTADRTGRE